jgi:hypothetical protein
MSEQLLKALNRQFDPFEALPADDDRYVDCDRERGNERLLIQMRRTITDASTPASQLFSGHRGGGKTTELLRLIRDLRNQGYFVVYIEADKYLNIADVQLPDVLLSVAQQLWIEAEEAQIPLAPGRIRSVLEDIWSILNRPIDLNKVGIKQGFLELGFEVKNSADNRALVRQRLGPRITSLLEAVNEVIARANEYLNQKNYEGMVIVLDNMDRILNTQVSGAPFSSFTALFVNGAEILRGLQCHTINTVPTALLHSPDGAKLVDLFGQIPRVLPMIPIATRDGSSFEAGIQKLIDIVDKRTQRAGAGHIPVFDAPETLRELVCSSGGYVRNLMTLTREALNSTDSLPLTLRDVTAAKRRLRDSLVMATPSRTEWEMLRQIAATHRIEHRDAYLQLLLNFTVFEYLDDDGQWYDVNPILKEAREFSGQ